MLKFSSSSSSSVSDLFFIYFLFFIFPCFSIQLGEEAARAAVYPTPVHTPISTNAMLPAGLYHIVYSETSILNRISILLCLFVCLLALPLYFAKIDVCAFVVIIAF